MLTQENDVEIYALAARGWNQSAISRHTGRDRKTVRKYLAAGELPVRERAASCLEPWRAYIAARFVDDPHLPAVTLFDELTAAGFDRSYPTLVRELRRTGLRPVCLVCQQRRGRAPTTEIDHPPGEEIQWDWLELPVTPWEQPGYVLVGALSHSGRFRAVFCEQMTFGHLAGAVHEILIGLGGTSLVWRVDRMATAVIPGTDRLNPQFAQLAKYYGVDVAICPAHRPQRKGVVEAAIKFIGGRWWRTAKAASMRDAQQSLDTFTVNMSDRRGWRGITVGELGAAEPLRRCPRSRSRRRSSLTGSLTPRAGLVRDQPATAFRRAMPASGSRPSTRRRAVPADRDYTGIKVAIHRRAPAGAEQTVRSTEHAGPVRAGRWTHSRPRPRADPSSTGRPATGRSPSSPSSTANHRQVAPVVSLTDYAKLAEVAC